MTHKVKRGLGLIVLAPLIWVAAAMLSALGKRSEGGLWVFKELGITAALVSVICGLVLIAWGLLRD